MKRILLITTILAQAIAAGAAARTALPAASAVRENVQKTTETQIRRLVEPLLDKYCREQCKLLSVAVNMDISVPETNAPGFDDIPPVGQDALAPTDAKLKLLMADKVGSVSRGKLLELIQRYLDTLDYPTSIETQVVHFPDPAGSEGRIAELRERISRNFQNTVAELIQQFCPEQCLFTDFNLKTDVVNSEEAQYGNPGEFVQEGDIALKIKELGGTLLTDETLNPEERGNILEMIKLKTTSFRNVNLASKTLRFPRPGSFSNDAYGTPGADGTFYGGRRVPASEKSTNETKNSTHSSDSKQLSNSRETSKLTNTSDSTASQNSTSKNNSNTHSSENDVRQERFEHFEKIERVESGDAVQAELGKLKVYALIFGCSVLSLLIFIAIASTRGRKSVFTGINGNPFANGGGSARAGLGAGDILNNGGSGGGGTADAASTLSRRLEIQRLTDELVQVFGQHPRVAKHVFTRIITEEGIEVTSQYLHIFGESIVVEMLRDPSLQSDLSELMEFYARTVIELEDGERLELLRKLHQRTTSGKLAVMGNRSSNMFDFLGEMDAVQILEMIRSESITVQAIILTQCDTQKRALMYSRLDEDVRMRLLTELSRIDYLPRDYIFNVANALKRKRRENPRLNTEALPGSEILVSLLERTGTGMQRDVMRNLEASSPDSARNVKGKLVSVDTLRYLRDGQLLEVVLSLRHDELIQFLKGAPAAVRETIFAKSPRELVIELEDELSSAPAVNRESYFTIERKVLNRMKLMANDGLINLIETNERMFADPNADVTGSFGNGAVVGSEREAG